MSERGDTAAEELPRPGPIARWARVLFAGVTLLFLVPAWPGLVWMAQNRRPISLGPLELLSTAVAALWLIPSAVQLFGPLGKKESRLGLLVASAGLAAWSWLSTGDPFGPILALPLLFLAVGLLLLLSFSFLLAALFAIPG